MKYDSNANEAVANLSPGVEGRAPAHLVHADGHCKNQASSYRLDETEGEASCSAKPVSGRSKDPGISCYGFPMRPRRCFRAGKKAMNMKAYGIRHGTKSGYVPHDKEDIELWPRVSCRIERSRGAAGWYDLLFT